MKRPRDPKPKAFYIYVLNLEGENYYVGSTVNLPRRLKEHFLTKAGRSSVWCQKHRPVSVAHTQGVFGTVKEALDLEDRFALGIAKAIGIERVRGGKLSGNADSPLKSWNRFLDGIRPMPMHRLIPLSNEEVKNMIQRTLKKKRSHKQKWLI